MPRALLRVAHLLDVGLAWAEEAVMVAFLSVAAILGVVQVVLRYVFSSGREWLEPSLVILVVDAAMIGAAVAARRSQHVRLDLLPLALPPRPRRALHVLANLLGCIFTVVLAVAGAAYVRQVVSFDMVNVESGFPDWVHYIGVPIAMSVVALRFLQQAVKSIFAPEPCETEPKR